MNIAGNHGRTESATPNPSGTVRCSAALPKTIRTLIMASVAWALLLIGSDAKIASARTFLNVHGGPGLSEMVHQ